VDAAVAMRERGVALATATRADVDLARLRPLVAASTQELQDGRGFVLVRRFLIDRLDEEAGALAYFALGLQLGQRVSQDAAGRLLGPVRDQGVTRTSPAIRCYATNERQDFHTDGADIIGLLCLQRARRGGESRIASAAAVYNEILARDPHALEVLYRPTYWDRNDEQPPGEALYFEMPVLSNVGGRARFFYIGWYIRDAQRHPGRTTTHRRTTGRHGAHRRNRQRSDIPRRDGLPPLTASPASTRPFARASQAQRSRRDSEVIGRMRQTCLGGMFTE
jgi:hypothetical protein